MFENLVRLASGLFSLAGGLIFSVLTLFLGGKVAEQLNTPSPQLLLIVPLALLCTVSAGLTVLFAFGLMSTRTGPPRPRLWLACIGAGVVISLLAAWTVGLGR